MRKALIIGLGGTGTSICNWLAERLRWEYGDLRRVPFLDFYCLDTSEDVVSKGTEPGQNPPLHDQSHFLHLSIPEPTFEKMRRKPEDYDSHSNFSHWYNSDVMKIKNVVNDGTGGIRMLGRMAMLLPENWNSIYAAVNDKLKSLVALTPGDAQAKFGQQFDGTVPNIQFPDKVTVYVIATSCGGTGSGSFIEMGYLLRQMKLTYPNLNTIGILTLPSNSVDRNRYKANAYATLIELNHFSSNNNEYHDQYPNIGAVSNYNYPYDFPYLVTVDVSRAAQGGLADYKELNYTVAQYIFSDVLFDVANVRDGRRDDVASQFISSDKRGLSQRFMTFGVSFIQYPVERIMRGCTYTLLKNTFETWLTDHSGSVGSDPAAAIQMTPDDLYRYLGNTTGGSLEDRVDRNIQNLIENYAGLEDIDALQEQFEATFHADGQAAGDAPAPALPRSYIPGTAERNRALQTADCIERLHAHIGTSLFDVDRGPSYCLTYLERLRAQLQERQKATISADPAEKDELYRLLEEANNDILLRFPLPLTRKVEAQYLDEWNDAAKTYYRQRLRQALLPAAQQLCREMEGETQRLEVRVQNVEMYLRSGRDAFITQLKEQDRSFNINGLLLFQEGVTIPNEYDNQLKATPRYQGKSADQAEQEAKREVVGKLMPLAIAPAADRTDLFAPPGRSFFDATPAEATTKYQRLRSADETSCVNYAKTFFLGIKSVNVVDAMTAQYGQEQMKTELKRVISLADWFLPLDVSASEFEDLPEKKFRWAFYRGANNDNPTHNLKEFQDAVGKSVQTGTDIQDLADPHTLIALSEYGAFPLRIIRTVNDWRRFYDSATGKKNGGSVPVADLQGEKVPTLFTREDVSWVTFEEGERDKLAQAAELFLVGLALEYIRPLQGGSAGFVFKAEELRGDDDTLAFDADLGKSVRTLYDADNHMRVLRNRIHSKRAGGKNDKLIIDTLYNDFLNSRFETSGLTGVRGKNQKERKNFIKSIFFRFLQRQENASLLRAYKEFFQPDSFSIMHHKKDDPIDADDPSRGTYHADGYYCLNPTCNLYYGETERSIPDVCPNKDCQWLHFKDKVAA